MSVRRPITLVEVARMAGVSNATVSVVMSGTQSNSRVSEETRERVLAVAREVGYQPNAVARSLRRRSTNTIGFYCGFGYIDATLPFFAQIIGGLQKGCDAHRKDLLLQWAFPGRQADEIYAELVDGRVDGLILYAPNLSLVTQLAESHLPVIAVVDPIKSLPSVGVDDAAGGAMLAEHLYQTGRTRVCYLTAPRQMTASDRRYRAFRVTAEHYSMVVTEIAASVDGKALLDQWLAMDPAARPNAVAAWNDLAAYTLLAECNRAGVRVPEDLAITGFDAMASPFGASYQLTTVRAPWHDVAYTALDLLVGQLNGGDPPMETLLPVELVQGATT